VTPAESIEKILISRKGLVWPFFGGRPGAYDHTCAGKRRKALQDGACDSGRFLGFVECVSQNREGPIPKVRQHRFEVLSGPSALSGEQRDTGSVGYLSD